MDRTVIEIFSTSITWKTLYRYIKLILMFPSTRYSISLSFYAYEIKLGVIKRTSKKYFLSPILPRLIRPNCASIIPFSPLLLLGAPADEVAVRYFSADKVARRKTARSLQRRGKIRRLLTPPPGLARKGETALLD